MDLHSIDQYVLPHTRADLVGLGAGDGLMGGGTWLLSEPQPHLRRLVDLRGMRWEPLEVDDEGLLIAATCTLQQLISGDHPSEWLASPLFAAAADALLASWKIWQNATVGGNLCLGFPAGAMIAMCAALDAELLIWRRDGSETRCSPVEFVQGNARTILDPGDVLRSIRIPVQALRQRTALRKVALSPLGRSAVVVVVRAAEQGMVVTVTCATERPYVVPTSSDDPAQVATQVDSQIPPDAYYTDAHGAADWRRHMTGVLVRHAVGELAS
ncbi:FAD binding domain-containing protein [Williamsia sterculiae]|uniref:CO or xanthine dehydrogenase, FAD-binding subunit n=1 Tax=Williamsia sterculiae TaxID=1344003 RepID=A0A1N7DYX0_9NOCA|nr:FAD binding domain-containing protein [Williamsia sterculiae]SIR81030.1 CO or xanthine dehydrogenase, FAD-binding subunit [Williamsia sterculiae]